MPNKPFDPVNLRAAGFGQEASVADRRKVQRLVVTRLPKKDAVVVLDQLGLLCRISDS